MTSNVSKQNETQKLIRKIRKFNWKQSLKITYLIQLLLYRPVYTLPFSFFTTLSSPRAPFWNAISLKCVCVCARLPACLTVYVRVCVDQKNEWWVVVWNIKYNSCCYHGFYYLFVLTITIRQHTYLYIYSSNTKSKTKKNAAKWKC